MAAANAVTSPTSYAGGTSTMSAGGQTTYHGRARAGRVSRVQAVNIESQVYGAVPHDLPHPVGDFCRAQLVHLVGIENIETHGLIIGCAQPDLHGVDVFNEAVLHRMVKHCAVIDALASLIIRPGVRMGVKMHQ